MSHEVTLKQIKIYDVNRKCVSRMISQLNHCPKTMTNFQGPSEVVQMRTVLLSENLPTDIQSPCLNLTFDFHGERFPSKMILQQLQDPQAIAFLSETQSDGPCDAMHLRIRPYTPSELSSPPSSFVTLEDHEDSFSSESLVEQGLHVLLSNSQSNCFPEMLSSSLDGSLVEGFLSILIPGTFPLPVNLKNMVPGRQLEKVEVETPTIKLQEGGLSENEMKSDIMEEQFDKIRFSDEACDGEDQMYEAAMASSSQTIQEEEKQKKTLEDIEWWIEKAEKTTNKVTHAVLEIAERQHLAELITGQEQHRGQQPLVLAEDEVVDLSKGQHKVRSDPLGDLLQSLGVSCLKCDRQGGVEESFMTPTDNSAKEWKRADHATTLS